MQDQDFAASLRLTKYGNHPARAAGRPPHDDAVALWYDEALRERQETLATIDELRVRSGTLLTVSALVTTLFATLASSSHRDISHNSLEQAALGLFIFLAILMGIILMPMYDWGSFARPGRVRRKVTGPQLMTGVQVKEYQARKIPKDVKRDRRVLGMLMNLFVVAVFALIAEVTCFSFAVL